MDDWPGFIAAVLTRYGVADVALAAAHDIAPSRFYRRTAREGWEAPARRVRIHPSAGRSVQRDLLVACHATDKVVAAGGFTAAWLRGLVPRPPPRPSVVTQQASPHLPPGLRVMSRRARWLEPGDVSIVQHVPTLRPAPMLVSCLATSEENWWPLLIDVTHRRLADPGEVRERLDRIGALPGSARLRVRCQELSSAVIESIFQDAVATELEALGYQPARGALRIPTADGIGLTVDVPLPAWKVAVEPDGDAFHRTREQRRLDRRRAAAFASIEWARVPVDWRDWHLDREHVLAAIDAAIAQQRARGIGAHVAPPRRR